MSIDFNDFWPLAFAEVTLLGPFYEIIRLD
jgi:hypothetical protein